MSVRLDRLGEDRARALRKREEWDAKYKELDRLYENIFRKKTALLQPVVEALPDHLRIQGDTDQTENRCL